MYMEEETWCTLWADSPYHTYLPSKNLRADPAFHGLDRSEIGQKQGAISFLDPFFALIFAFFQSSSYDKAFKSFVKRGFDGRIQ
jgi:hypothetical protein